MSRPPKTKTTRQKRDDRHESFLRHKNFLWLKRAAGLSLIAILGYALIDVRPHPNGGSAYGYTLGVISTGLIIWLMLLGLRKRAMTPGAWSLKAWVSAHIYLGLSLIVLATLHTGFQFGWNVHTLAYVLMMIVIFTGIYGVIVYVRLPTVLGANRGEVTQKLMVEELVGLDRQLSILARPLTRELAAIVLMSVDPKNIAGGIWRRLTNQHQDCKTRAAIDQLSRAVPSATDAPILAEIQTLLDRKASVLKMVRTHIQIRSLLVAWLYIHVPATFGLLAALTAHIVSVFFYW